MDDLNQVAIAGRLTRDPQLRMTRNGTPICNLRIACNKMFFNIKVWGDQGQQIAGNTSKGDVLQIDGRLDWYEWSPGDGPRREFVGVVANDSPGSVRCIAQGPGSSMGMAQNFTGQSASGAGIQGNQDYGAMSGTGGPGVDFRSPIQPVDLQIPEQHPGLPAPAPVQEQASPFATEEFGSAVAPQAYEQAVAPVPAPAPLAPVAPAAPTPVVPAPAPAPAPAAVADISQATVAGDAAVAVQAQPVESIQLAAVAIAPAVAEPAQGAQETYIAAAPAEVAVGVASDGDALAEEDNRFI
jgi:single-strand DNA-binding protein